jgi:hypothetical protein
MSTLIVATSAAMCLIYAGATRWLLGTTQTWRKPTVPV